MPIEDDTTRGDGLGTLFCTKCNKVQEHKVVNAGYSNQRDGRLRVTKCHVCGHQALWVMRQIENCGVEPELVYRGGRPS